MKKFIEYEVRFELGGSMVKQFHTVDEMKIFIDVYDGKYGKVNFLRITKEEITDYEFSNVIDTLTKKNLVLNIVNTLQLLDANSKWESTLYSLNYCNYSKNELEMVLQEAKNVCFECLEYGSDINYIRKTKDILRMIDEAMED